MCHRQHAFFRNNGVIQDVYKRQARREALQDKHSLDAQIKLAYQEEQDRANVWHIDTKKFLAGAMGEDGKDNKERLKEMVELTQRDAHTLNYSKFCFLCRQQAVNDSHSDQFFGS